MTSATTAAQPAPLPGDRAQHGVRQPLSSSERWGSVLEYLLTVYRRTWRGSIIGRFLSPLFFLLSMGLGLGALVDDRAGGVGGTPYLQFVVPAIVATQAMWVAMGESTYQVLGYIKWNMGYHAMLATPLGVRDILVGHLLSVVGHLTVATAIFMGVAALFGGFSSWWALLSLPIAVLTGMAFTVPIFAFTARQEGDNGFNILFRWVMTPLMLFSGTFFPVDQLPLWMQPVAWFTPLWHGVESSRMVATGQVDWPWLALHLLVLATFVAVGWVLAVRSFTRRLVT
jgi:lipooligosaccharide transport system permease protein